MGMADSVGWLAVARIAVVWIIDISSFDVIAICTSSARALAETHAQDASMTPAAAPNDKAAEGLLDRLYHLVWPAGRFAGDIDKLVQRTTQKGNAVPDLPRLYLVNTKEQTATEWKSARGAVEPAYCAQEQLLFYRRGNRLVKEKLRVVGTSAEPTSKPALVDAVEIGHLHACAV